MRTTHVPSSDSRSTHPLDIAIANSHSPDQHRTSLRRSITVIRRPQSAAVYDDQPALSPSSLVDRQGTPDVVSAAVAVPSWETTDAQSSYLYGEAVGHAPTARQSTVASDTPDVRQPGWDHVDMSGAPLADPEPSSPNDTVNRLRHVLRTSRLEIEALSRENLRLREQLNGYVTSGRELNAAPEAQQTSDSTVRQPNAGKSVLSHSPEAIENIQRGVELLGPPNTARPDPQQASNNEPTIAQSFAGPQKPLLFSETGTFTPRSILLLKILQQRASSQDLSAADDNGSLDRSLTVNQATTFAKAVAVNPGDANSLLNCLRTCTVCRVPKFHFLPLDTLVDASFKRSNPVLDKALFSGRFSEFPVSPSGLTECCSQAICDTCYREGIISSLHTDYWHAPDSASWIRCPFLYCNSILRIVYNVVFAGMLTEMRDPNTLQHVMQFERATRLRDALRSLYPTPSPEALRRAARLHARLIKHQRMEDPLDTSLPPRLKLQMMAVESPDGSGSLQVPVFVDLLIRRGSSGGKDSRDGHGSSKPPSVSGRDCAVCAETLHDITDGTPEDEARWEKVIAGFPGPWTWEVRPFPVPSLLRTCSATHSLDICRTCLSRHLDALLESQGRSGSDALTCPSPGCGHAYSNEELRALASPETFAKYDKLRLLGHLATLPDFRWCLRQGCNNGQVYDFSANRNVLGTYYRVFCDACGFSMCFRHQVPWHAGQTCLEYEEARGDPDFNATREWLRNNTKPCPGMCGASVEKNDGCFHMTCQVCRFEFCWECLADWSQISKVHPATNERRYYRDAHNPGCFFRETRAPQATMIGGNTVAEALDGAW